MIVAYNFQTCQVLHNKMGAEESKEGIEVVEALSKRRREYIESQGEISMTVGKLEPVDENKVTTEAMSFRDRRASVKPSRKSKITLLRSESDMHVKYSNKDHNLQLNIIDSWFTPPQKVITPETPIYYDESEDIDPLPTLSEEVTEEVFMYIINDEEL